MDQPIELLLRLLDQAYDRQSWHGPNLKGAIRGVTPDVASWRPRPQRHNIWELVVHAAYWKYAARRRLSGGKRGTFALGGSNWFVRPVVGVPGQRQWHADLAILAAEHAALREAISGMTARTLSQPVGKAKFDVLSVVGGVIAHDVYHAGQIQAIKRLYGDRRRAEPGRGAVTRFREREET